VLCAKAALCAFIARIFNQGTVTMFRITSAVFAGFLGLWSVSQAAQADGITGEAGAGISYQPKEPTGTRYETAAVPYLDLDWGDVSLSTDDVSWHTATQIPEHVAQRYQRALKILRKSKDIHDADDALDKLNETPLKLHGRSFTPTEGLEGLLLELADNFRRYVETTPWWKLQWHVWTKKVPWLAQGQIKNKESPTT